MSNLSDVLSQISDLKAALVAIDNKVVALLAVINAAPASDISDAAKAQLVSAVTDLQTEAAVIQSEGETPAA